MALLGVSDIQARHYYKCSQHTHEHVEHTRYDSAALLAAEGAALEVFCRFFMAAVAMVVVMMVVMMGMISSTVAKFFVTHCLRIMSILLSVLWGKTYLPPPMPFTAALYFL